jgi:hypothetical protein
MLPFHVQAADARRKSPYSKPRRFPAGLLLRHDQVSSRGPIFGEPPARAWEAQGLGWFPYAPRSLGDVLSDDVEFRTISNPAISGDLDLVNIERHGYVVPLFLHEAPSYAASRYARERKPRLPDRGFPVLKEPSRGDGLLVLLQDLFHCCLARFGCTGRCDMFLPALGLIDRKLKHRGPLSR